MTTVRKLSIALTAVAFVLVSIAPANASGATSVNIVCGGSNVKHEMISAGTKASTQRMAAWNCGGTVGVADISYFNGITSRGPYIYAHSHATKSNSFLIGAHHRVRNTRNVIIASRTT